MVAFSIIAVKHHYNQLRHWSSWARNLLQKVQIALVSGDFLDGFPLVLPKINDFLPNRCIGEMPPRPKNQGTKHNEEVSV